MICENRLQLFKMRTYIEGGGQILVSLTPETGAEYRAKNREIKSRDRCYHNGNHLCPPDCRGKSKSRKCARGCFQEGLRYDVREERNQMLNINNDQKELLLTHLPNLQESIESGDIDTVLEDLDAKITEIGFNADYSLNETGQRLQKLYDELYDQN